MKAKKKRGVEAPPKVKGFINSVVNTPLENIDVPLGRFSWEYEKGEFHHWVDLFNHFEVFFDQHVKSRKDLQLEGEFLDGDAPFPKEAVLQILRVTRIILENCVNKYLYNSNEHVSLLFASTDPEIVIAALQTLAAFVKKPVQSSRAMRWHGDTTLNARLFSLSQGWGGKEEGLGLLACAVDNGCDANACKLGAAVHFEFYAESDSTSSLDEISASGLRVIHIPDVHLRPEGDLQLLKLLVDQYQVPYHLRFSLLTRIRFARAFANLNSRRQYICIRLIAFTVLFQSNPDHEDLTAFFINEPEFVDELVTVLRYEDTIPEEIRLLAVLALAAQSQDRPRQSNVLSVISVGGHRGILPSLMQKAIGSLREGSSGCSVSFVEALLSLVTVLVSSSTGCAALREAGLIPTLLPLLKDMDPQHTHLVSAAVHILEAFMDYSNPAGTLFRDLGGLGDTIARLKVEVSRVEEGANVEREESKAGKVEAATCCNPSLYQLGYEEADSQSSHVTGQTDTLIPYQQRLLLKALLRAIALGTYAPGNSARHHISEESALPYCLKTIFRYSKEFGGAVFSLAASVMSDLVHKDPTCFATLDSAGLPAAFLDAITSGVLPSSEAVGCIPNTLDALCLNPSGLQAVRDRNALGCFVKIFTSKMYLRALANDTPASLASGLDELLRHAPELRGFGIDMFIMILKTIAAIGGAPVEPAVPVTATDSSNVNAPVPMDTDFEERPSTAADYPPRASSSQQPQDSGADNNLEAFLPECINNAVRLLETVLQNADTSRIFIEKKGIEALLQLYTLPHLPVSFGGSSIAHNMSVTFRAFSPQHSGQLTQAVCGVLKNQLQATLDQLNVLRGTKVSDLDSGVRTKVVRTFSAAECYLSLSSVLVRSSNSMMSKLSAGAAEILNNVGTVHREVLWQLAMIVDAKVEPKRETEASPASVGVGTSAREGEEAAEAYPVVRYVNPVQIRNGPSSPWGIEPEFLSALHGNDGPHRRSRRDHPANAEALTQIARLGRLARQADSTRVDTESVTSLSETSPATEVAKRKSPESMNYDMMTRLTAAARGLYVALGKTMLMPSRRREDTVPLNSDAKMVAGTLAKLIRDNLSFSGHGEGSVGESTVSVKCRYLGKVVEDFLAVVFDSRRKTCNTVLLNNLYGHGAIKELLKTFAATSELLWTLPRNSGVSPMETENGKSKSEEKAVGNSWLLDTLRSYTRLMEYLVTSSLLLTPTSMAQILIQPVAGGSEPLAKDPEAFVRILHAEILDVVLPLWINPLFPQCSPTFISSIASIITHIYTGVGDTKTSRSGGGAVAGARLVGPPPDESTISSIVEMGFPRSRAEEALRRVGENSTEMAVEWLFSHPEEAVQEDDELARALALSLGSDGPPKEEPAPINQDKGLVAENEVKPVPPLEEMLLTCMNLLQFTDAVAFPITDLLVTMCNRGKGQHRPQVISYLVKQLKSCKVEGSVTDTCPLSTISHTLALLLSEDSTAREIAAQNGVVSIALDILEQFPPVKTSPKDEIPKWVTALLLVLDHMLVYKLKVTYDQPSGSVTTAAVSNSMAISSDTPAVADQSSEAVNGRKDSNTSPFISVLGKPSGYMTEVEQRRAMSVVTCFLRMQLPSATVQAVLQLCARLTKSYPIASSFFHSDGLTALFNYPWNCCFPGFDTIAAAIIRHLLEDPQTLQQTMEAEIRHTLSATLLRHNGRVSPHMFLTVMAPVLSRDPTIFMQAASVVCQLETLGGRPTIVLAKEKNKEKDKEKEKEQGQDKLPEKSRSTDLDTSTKVHESGKSGRGHHHKKVVPHSFSLVIEQLLDIILHYPPGSVDQLHEKEDELSSKDNSTAMDVDDAEVKDKGKGKVEDLPRSKPVASADMVESFAAIAKVTFILRLITDIIFMYSSAVSVVLRRDLESSQGRGPIHGGLDVVGHGGLLYHILHRLLPYPSEKVNDKVNEEEWREKLSDRAAYFVVAICVRSGEGRKRVVVEVARALTSASPTSSGPSEVSKALQSPSRKVRAFVDLVNSVLSSHSPTGSAQTPGFSQDMAKSMMDVGMVQALTRTLQVIDLDHPDAPKLVNSILKALEALTRVASMADRAYGSDGAGPKKSTEQQGIEIIHAETETRTEDGSHPQARDETMRDSVPQDATIPEIGPPPANSTEIVHEEHMEHNDGSDRDVAEEVNVCIEAEAEEEFMREAAEDAAELEGAAVVMHYSMEHGPDDEIVDEENDEEEDMDGDEGDDDGEEEEEEEDEDEDDMNADEDIFLDAGVPHLSPPDTDVEDHEDNGLGDDYEDIIQEDEDEDDDSYGDRVIEVRWRDGLTGLSHVQVLGHTGASNLVDFPGDPFQGMNMDDVFGSFRRPGGSDRRRTTTSRSFPERSGGERGGALHHPLLTRPSATTGGSVTTANTNNSLWPSTSSIVRDAEAMLGGGALDVTHFYMYDAPMITERTSEGVLVERGFGGAPPLLDFSTDSVYPMGRRGGRTESRLSSWTDDGQPQAGAQAAAVAHAIEEQFIEQLRQLVPSVEQASVQSPVHLNTTAAVESTEVRGTSAGRSIVGGESQGTQIIMGEQSGEAISEPPNDGGVVNSGRDEAHRLGSGSATANQRSTDLDVQMQDERSEPVVRDTEANSQDSGGSGATVGESLRSLEVEIGSADGHDEGDRHPGPERLVASELQPAGGVERVTASSRRSGQGGDIDEAMEGTGTAGSQQGGVIDEERRSDRTGEHLVAPAATSVGGHNSHGNTEGPNPSSSSIDPTFLEALPADLRAEVLASEQTGAVRPPNSTPTAPPEEIDPEFLAALPPDIQAEVLAQQRAQRAVIAQTIEGQPVDMDSASIIATFPAELREEVLLTSSEAVLAALPPALLAEAQLLRERAMNQYQARGLFGAATHRITHRRNNLGVGTGAGTGTTAEDGSLGAGAGVVVGRRPVALSSNSKMKEAEGKPLVDTSALKALLRLLRLAQPLGKGLLQRLLLNLCAHSVTRLTLLQLLLGMLRPEAEGNATGGISADGAQSQRLYGCQWNVVYARSQMSDGIPPLVSRRVLEILTYLARNHSVVANLLLYMEPLGQLGGASTEVSSHKGKEKGKAKVVEVSGDASEKRKMKGESPLVLLLKLLNQPLYSRNSAHLEQVMGLLEVVTTNAGSKAEAKSKATVSEGRSLPANTDSAPAEMAPAVTTPASLGGEAETVTTMVDSQPDLGAEAARSDALGHANPSTEDHMGPSTLGSSVKFDPSAILANLPEPELRNLCKLLAQEGLSDTAYTRVAEVLKKLATAAPTHRRLFVAELAVAARLLSGPAVDELHRLGNAETVAVSTTSMAGAAILRVLQALSALTTGIGNTSDHDSRGEGKEQEDVMLVRDLYGGLEMLWQGLSVCVGKIEGRLGNPTSLGGASTSVSSVPAAVIGAGPGSVAPPLPPGTQRLLPFVEAFFVLCEKFKAGSSQSGQNEPHSATASEIKEAEASLSTDLILSPPSPRSPRQLQKPWKPENEKTMTFIRFVEKHRRLLNAFVRQNPGLLEKSLCLLLRTPRLIDFDNKRAYFRSRIRQQHEQQHYSPLRICVRRAYVLEDSYNQLRMRTPDELKGRLTVQFQGEEGIDAGGLTREWYQLLSRVTFDKGALLFTTVGNESTFQPNPNSVYQTEHLSYFKFVGRVVAKALIDGQLLDVYFTRSFYKHILGVKVTYHDIEAIDPGYFKNLKWILENDISDLPDLTFSMDADEEKHILYEKTEVTDFELIPGGRDIRVTEENKHEYVDKVAEHRLTTAIRPQINAFMEGFNELVSRDLISIFNDKELELLISGLPEIDLDDLKTNTEYTGYTAASPVVQWFWDVVRSFSKEDMARLLQFITGTSKVPLEGFRALQGISGPQRFQIHKAYGAPERLPSAHTCFNQLDLPDYATKEQLQDRLLLAIHEGSEGFGFG
ncbi:E3 ubiquitin-protein ligase UPL1 isoform X3 [Physcomitrium patens]|uniref:HECT-type E3 ubiquitin transferase n=1 Tax=Physcomitrium patens TaxID=3218 RepID=A0A7I4EAA4_PHYPA|nr:E3 ubiquitin-protein ligase UPL1-like isoform X3 [Physcomitrium patens]|eukprot:XP_024379829.1 E3 ubiquitin-protein ligase UPL1-like isoform X3 [Physcomitrella patens]